MNKKEKKRKNIHKQQNKKGSKRLKTNKNGV